MWSIREAFISAGPPPPVGGVGNQGGFKMQLRDLNSAEMDRVLQSAYAIMDQAGQTPSVTGVFTTFSAASPPLFLEIDRRKAQMPNVPIANIFDTQENNPIGRASCRERVCQYV